MERISTEYTLDSIITYDATGALRPEVFLLEIDRAEHSYLVMALDQAHIGPEAATDD